MTKPRITGKLAKPIDNIFPFPRELEREQRMKVNPDQLFFVRIELFDRIDLLFPFFGIDRTDDHVYDLQRLVVRLARLRFPGFRVKDTEPKRYQHKHNNPLTLLLLLIDVDTVQRERNRRPASDAEVVKVLITQERFEKPWGGMTEKTLRNWLADASDPKKNRYLPFWQAIQPHDGPRKRWIEKINQFVRGRPYP
jgi:hypothetical protein